MVDPKEINIFPRKGKHKEIYMKGDTLEELHIKWVIEMTDQSQETPKEA